MRISVHRLPHLGHGTGASPTISRTHAPARTSGTPDGRAGVIYTAARFLARVIGCGQRPIHLIPSQVHKLGDAQPVTISHEDHGRVAMAVAVFTRRLDELRDFIGRQIFPRSELRVWQAPWRDCSFRSVWRNKAQRRFCYGSCRLEWLTVGRRGELRTVEELGSSGLVSVLGCSSAFMMIPSS